MKKRKKKEMEKRTIIHVDEDMFDMIEQRRNASGRTQKATVEDILYDVLLGEYDDLLESKAPRATPKRFSVNKELCDEVRDKVKQWRFNLPQAIHIILNHQLEERDDD